VKIFFFTVKILRHTESIFTQRKQIARISMKNLVGVS
jgi:hypothetical protein